MCSRNAATCLLYGLRSSLIWLSPSGSGLRVFMPMVKALPRDCRHCIGTCGWLQQRVDSCPAHTVPKGCCRLRPVACRATASQGLLPALPVCTVACSFCVFEPCLLLRSLAATYLLTRLELCGGRWPIYSCRRELSPCCFLRTRGPLSAWRSCNIAANA